MFDERVEAIAVNLEDSWSETFFSNVDSSLAQCEDFRCGKRYKCLKTSEHRFRKHVGDSKKDRGKQMVFDKNWIYTLNVDV